MKTFAQLTNKRQDRNLGCLNRNLLSSCSQPPFSVLRKDGGRCRPVGIWRATEGNSSQEDLRNQQVTASRRQVQVLETQPTSSSAKLNKNYMSHIPLHFWRTARGDVLYLTSTSGEWGPCKVHVLTILQVLLCGLSSSLRYPVMSKLFWGPDVPVNHKPLLQYYSA